jgi:hypothetical protein
MDGWGESVNMWVGGQTKVAWVHGSVHLCYCIFIAVMKKIHFYYFCVQAMALHMYWVCAHIMHFL